MSFFQKDKKDKENSGDELDKLNQEEIEYVFESDRVRAKELRAWKINLGIVIGIAAIAIIVILSVTFGR